MPTVLNAANEVAVEAFLQEEIGFVQIPETVRMTMKHHQVRSQPDLDAIMEADRWARQYAASAIRGIDTEFTDKQTVRQIDRPGLSDPGPGN